jgi:hypothetical protein
VTVSPRFPWETDPVSLAPRPKPRGRRPASLTRTAVLAPTTAPDWLYHHLTISGPADGVENFAAAARGAGAVPWRLDGADLEDTVFNLAVAQPARGQKLTVAGCRILARQFRDRVEAHQVRAAARVGHSFLCAFDLHALLPVPDDILQRGPTHPTALAWLAANWGVTDSPRQVSIREKATTGRRLPRGHRVIGYGFFTLGETPEAAIAQLAAQWTARRFRLVARPAD